MESLTIQSERWVQNGVTIAHAAIHQKTIPVFIHGAIPGETVQVRILQQKENHAFALVTDVLESAPGRVDSDCEAYPLCGGCSYRHVSYEEELAIKRKLLDELNPLGEILQSLEAKMLHAQPDHYRNHMQIRCNGNQKGFYETRSNRLVPMPKTGCKQASLAINERMLSFSECEQNKRLHFRETDEGVLSPAHVRANRQSTITIEKLKWSFPADSFFQANRYLILPWLQTIKTMTPESNQLMVELFSGSGIISGFLQEKWDNLIAIDFDSPALRFFKNNFPGRENDIQTIRMDLQKKTPALSGADTIILDPPRAGINRALQHAIGTSGAKKVIYSSCNPQTLNRDAAALIKHYSFKPVAATILDFFPRTSHLELVVAFEPRRL